MPLAITPVQPIGSKKCRVIDGSSSREVELDVWEIVPAAREFRKRRVMWPHYLNLREAAKRLGITATQVSGLEWGKYTCDWAEARRLLDEGGEG